MQISNNYNDLALKLFIEFVQNYSSNYGPQTSLTTMSTNLLKLKFTFYRQITLTNNYVLCCKMIKNYCK